MSVCDATNTNIRMKKSVFYLHVPNLLTLACCLTILLSGFVPVANAAAPKSKKQSKATPSVSSEADLYPDGISFFDQKVGTTGPAQKITLLNSGTAPLNIVKMVTTANFTQTNNCGTSVPVGGSCTITAHFAPTSATNVTGTLTVTDDAPDSPQVVNFAGTGITGSVLMLPSALDLGSQTVGKATKTASASVTNVSGVKVTITSIVASGDFSQTNNCASPMNPSLGQACRVDITFTPTAAGTRTGNITITDSAAGSPHIINLTGEGAASSNLSFSPANLSFGNVTLGATSAAKVATVTNNGTTPVSIISIVAAGDYSQTNTCGTSIAVGGNCTMNVTFTPSSSGARAGRITLSDSDPTNLQTFTLNGTGVIPASTVAITPKVAALTSKLTQQFQATINGQVSTDVTWSVDNVVGGNSTVGTITTSGLYTPPTAAGTHKVRAKSNADQSQIALSFAYVSNYPGTVTYQNDNARTGQNLSESILTTGNVNSTQFGKLFSYPVDGKVYAQPLYVANLNVPGKGFHNVIYVATEHDSIYAFDADNRQTTPLWQVSFINPSAGVNTLTIGITGGEDLFCDSMKPEVGITGTPVINPATNTMYVVVRTKEVNGSSTNFVQRLHALDITTGAEKPSSPVVIQGSYPGHGVGSDGQGNVLFDPLYNNQRSGLMLLNGLLYIQWASFCDPASYHGWLMAYDPTSLQQLSLFNSTPNGWGGGIWQSGAAPAADTNGNIFVATGNGTFDASFGSNDYSDSVLKLSTVGGLTLTDYFTPFNEYWLIGPDLDLGSGGVTVLPDQPTPPTHLLVAGGKEGTLYLIDRDNLGRYDRSNNDQIVQTLNHAAGGPGTGDKGIWPKGAYWQNQIYYVGTGDVPKAYRLFNGQLSVTPVSSGPLKFGYPGGAPVVSSNGAKNGIVWLVAEATPQHIPVVLYAYNAADLSQQLYASSGTATGLGVQFAMTTVANGKVFVGTASELDVFGLLP
jgi:hypothetical protein